jgi:DNA-binding response OmpR family regulator
MTTRAHILLVEDDINLGYVIKDNLEVRGFTVTWCNDGEKGWEQFRQQAFDICLLDIMLPRKDGISLAQAIRQQNDLVPVIFLTAKSMKEDKISGFKAGADDYITKPFSIEELVLRMEVFLKRTRKAPLPQHTFAIGHFLFNYSNLLLTYAGHTIHLTQKEADILRMFCQHPNQVLKRQDILNAIWGDDDYFIGRSLDVFISKLRKYMKEDARITIDNLHGIGFRMTIRENVSITGQE